jgi:hypothetical protein
VDVSCSAAKDDIRTRAVVKINFKNEKEEYVHCSGTLLNSAKRDYKPYLLVANHCISQQAEADTLEVEWNHRSVSCNTSNRSPQFYKSERLGAQLLYSSKNTDTTLLLLNGKPPDTAVFAGWDANSPTSIGTNVFSLHYPQGDMEKYSVGVSAGFYSSCQNKNDCFTPLNQASNNRFYAVRWSQGITEKGSSGGPLFFSNKGQVIGQLFGGHSSCTSPADPDIFSRFDLPFKDGMWKWLSPDYK